MSFEPEQLARISENERGAILRLLLIKYPGGMTPGTLLTLLDLGGNTVSMETLRFHIAYLQEKGYVRTESAEAELGHAPVVRLATITPAGVDLLDKRRSGEPGVRI